MNPHSTYIMKILITILFLSLLPAHSHQISGNLEPTIEHIDADYLIVDDSKKRRIRARRRLMANIYDNPDPLEGPWPECVGMKGSTCKAYIEGWIAELAPPGIEEHTVRIIDKSVKEQADNIWIESDKYGNVVGDPHVG